ncbi:MAG TPA: type II 3-dehydroquinate dehydratase, partial [Syntrophaceae bacterium]|nr:type II 3-dehydroquinate dehydratase [Syntrophaceae bacterium]
MANPTGRRRILIIHGPNLNLLGNREKDIYGSLTLDQINEKIKKAAARHKAQVEIFQSNIEGELVEKVQKAYGKFDAIIINPAAYTHTSIAIRDAILAVGIPTIEVHLSNVYKREDFRQVSFISDIVEG